MGEVEFGGSHSVGRLDCRESKVLQHAFLAIDLVSHFRIFKMSGMFFLSSQIKHVKLNCPII